jgi:hypothetical protein
MIQAIRNLLSVYENSGFTMTSLRQLHRVPS